VVLAAGLARRYGGLKQLDAVGPEGECFADLTIRDARRAGFGQAILVVREETAARFIAHFEKRLPPVPVCVLAQRRDRRTAHADGSWKPWGTAHALLAIEGAVTGGACIANADDYYGPEPLRTVAAWLESDDVADAITITFRLDRTLSEHGGVVRAVCHTANGLLTGIAEYSDVRRTGDRIVGRVGDTVRVLDAGEPVCMNLWGFRRGAFVAVRRAFDAFLSMHEADAEAELTIVDAIAPAIADNRVRVRAVETGSRWTGLTYPADRDRVVRQLRELYGSAE